MKVAMVDKEGPGLPSPSRDKTSGGASEIIRLTVFEKLKRAGLKTRRGNFEETE